MHGIERKVGEEWLVLVGFNELGGVPGETGREVLTLRALNFHLGILKGREILLSGVGATACPASNIDIKALALRVELLGVPQVPFAGKEGGVSFGLECFSDGDFFGSHVIDQWGGIKLPGSFAGKEVGGLDSGRVFARHKAVSGW